MKGDKRTLKIEIKEMELAHEEMVKNLKKVNHSMCKYQLVYILHQKNDELVTKMREEFERDSVGKQYNIYRCHVVIQVNSLRLSVIQNFKCLLILYEEGIKPVKQQCEMFKVIMQVEHYKFLCIYR